MKGRQPHNPTDNRVPPAPLRCVLILCTRLAVVIRYKPGRGGATERPTVGGDRSLRAKLLPYVQKSFLMCKTCSLCANIVPYVQNSSCHDCTLIFFHASLGPGLCVQLYSGGEGALRHLAMRCGAPFSIMVEPKPRCP